MTKQTINIGTAANDKTGDPLRTAFAKVNANFTELYALTGSAESVQELVQDYATPLLTHVGHSGISFVYDDILNKIVATVSVIPTQLGNSGRYLTTDGVNLAWGTVATDTISNAGATLKLQASLGKVVVSTGIHYELFNGSKFGEDNNSTTALSSMTGGKLILRTTNSLNTVRDWEFSDAGNLKLPATGNIFTNGGVAYNDWTNITGKPTIPTSFSSLVNGVHTLSLGSTGNTTFPTGLTLGAPRGVNTVNFTAAVDKEFQIETGTATSGKLWRFGTDGTTTFPTNISINYSGGNVQFPRIIADSGKAFSVQGQGTSGSAAMSWTVDPDAAGQYAAVGVTKNGGDNLAKVILTAQSNSGSAGTAKTWKFDETGTTTLPLGGTITEGGGLTGAIKLTPAGGANANQTLLIYPTAGGDGDHVHLTAGGGTTELYLGDDSRYVKLVNGGNIEVRATTANASASAAWSFGTDGAISTTDPLIINVPNGVPTGVGAIASTTGSWEQNPLSNLVTTGGSGTGLRVNVTYTGGYASAIAIAIAGTGYLDGELITVTSGSSSASFIIAVTGTINWRFGTDGTLRFPDSTTQTGKSITVPVNQVFDFNLSRTSPPGFTSKVSISPGGLTTDSTLLQFMTTDSKYWTLDSGSKRIRYSESTGQIVFGTATKNGTGASNDIELFAYGADNGVGSVYLSAGSTPTNNRWKFDASGRLTTPQTSSVFVLGTDFTGTIIGDGDGTGYIRVESNTGSPNFTPSPISTRFYNFLSTLTAGTRFTVLTIVDGTTYNTVVAFTQFAGGNPVDPNRNDLYYTFVSGDDLPFSYNATALTLTFTSTSVVVAPTSITFADATVQTTAYIAPTTGDNVISSAGLTISRNGMTIRVTSAGMIQMSFNSIINITGRSSINNADSAVIASPNGATVISTWYNIGAVLALGDHLTATIVDASFHRIYRLTVIISSKDTTPGLELVVAYAIIEQIQ